MNIFFLAQGFNSMQVEAAMKHRHRTAVVVSKRIKYYLSSLTAKWHFTLEVRIAQNTEPKRRFKSEESLPGQASTLLPVQPRIFSPLETWRHHENYFFCSLEG